MDQRLVPPVTYQGGKGRLAAAIARLIPVPDGATFCDLCCGSGAVSLAMLEAGLPPDRLAMVDIGPWGAFWAAIGDGTFDCGRLEEAVARLPEDPAGIKTALEELALGPADGDGSVYAFLLLQAGSFGGKAVGRRGGRWVTHGFRPLWTPKPGCSRKSPVNPMMPMPGTLLARARELARRCAGLSGAEADAVGFRPPLWAVAYIDPPYGGTTRYAGAAGLDAVAVARGLGCPCYVSEARPFGGCSLLLSRGRAKGGISGGRGRANEEWLSAFNAPPLRLET